MKVEDYREGMPVIVKKQYCIATALELCGDGSHVVHVSFPGKECQWRVPIDQVEADPR